MSWATPSPFVSAAATETPRAGETGWRERLAEEHGRHRRVDRRAVDKLKRVHRNFRRASPPRAGRGDRQVRDAIASEVPRSDIERPHAPERIRDRGQGHGCKSGRRRGVLADAAIEGDDEMARLVAGHRDVDDAVRIEIAHRERIDA